MLKIGQHVSTATTPSLYKTADHYVSDMLTKLYQSVLSHALMLDFYRRLFPEALSWYNIYCWLRVMLSPSHFPILCTHITRPPQTRAGQP